MEGVDNPIEIINYIAIQSETSEELAKKILMEVSGWDGENLDVPVEELSRFADDATRMAESVKNIMRKYRFDEVLAYQIVFLTKNIVSDVPDWDINPDFVTYCLIKTMENGEINEYLAKEFVAIIFTFSLQHPEYNIDIEFQSTIVDMAVEASQEHNQDLIISLEMIIDKLSKGLKEGGKSKKSKSKKYNRKSRGKKHNKMSKSKKIRKP
jgi:hypothetical protein